MGVYTMGQKSLGRNPKRRRYHKLPRMREKLRILSNIGLIAGQCTLLFLSRDIGLIILILSSFLSVPYFYREKMWDVLGLMGFMLIVNLFGLFFQ
jgi:hypothetical protein